MLAVLTLRLHFLIHSDMQMYLKLWSIYVASNGMFYLDHVCLVLLERVPGISLPIPFQGLMEALVCLCNWSSEAWDLGKP